MRPRPGVRLRLRLRRLLLALLLQQGVGEKVGLLGDTKGILRGGLGAGLLGCVGSGKEALEGVPGEPVPQIQAFFFDHEMCSPFARVRAMTYPWPEVSLSHPAPQRSARPR